MKRNSIRNVLLTFLFFVPLAQAGVGGIGNTTDLTIQLGLAKEASIRILQSVSIFHLANEKAPTPVIELYRACRDTMYRGSVATQFRIVETIPDGEGYHALAKRVGQETWISRNELEKTAREGKVPEGLLVTVLLHEVAHDCVMNGDPVDDRFDEIINQLISALIQVAEVHQHAAFKDMEFVARVKAGERPGFQDLSGGSQLALTHAYLDYLGDWVYERYRDRFRYRPAPASKFYASAETAMYPGWAYLHEAVYETSPELDLLVYGIMRACFEEKGFAQYEGHRRVPLRTSLHCSSKYNVAENLSFVDCVLEVSWSTLPSRELSQLSQRMDFELDSLGRIRVKRIRF